MLLFFFCNGSGHDRFAAFNVPLVSLTNYNTSASSAYNQHNFRSNFIPATSDIDTHLDTIATDPRHQYALGHGKAWTSPSAFCPLT